MERKDRQGREVARGTAALPSSLPPLLLSSGPSRREVTAVLLHISSPRHPDTLVRLVPHHIVLLLASEPVLWLFPSA